MKRKGWNKQNIRYRFLREQENSDYLKNSLRILASALYREYGKYPVLLIDEYDVPLANASYHDTTNKSFTLMIKAL